MSYEEKRANEIISMIRDNKDFRILERIGKDPTLGIQERPFDIKATARLEEVGGVWSWVSTVKVITDQIIIKNERVVSEDYPEQDINSLCHIVLYNIILRGLFVEESRG